MSSRGRAGGAVGPTDAGPPRSSDGGRGSGTPTVGCWTAAGDRFDVLPRVVAVVDGGLLSVSANRETAMPGGSSARRLSRGGRCSGQRAR